MENKHIELVKKWLADPESVTPEELKANSESAYAADVAYWAAHGAFAPDAVNDAYLAARAADAADSADATYWVRKYEGRTDA